MKTYKEYVSNFLKNKSKENYREIVNIFFKDIKKCKYCGDCVYYYDSSFRINKISLLNKSVGLFKNINGEKYYLCCCEDCLILKFPEYSTKNKSRVFNHMNNITEYAFDIPNNISLEWRSKNYAITLENLIKKWGDDIGTEKWGEYCKKQSDSNKFEYKKERYGWSKEKFKDYNKSRSVTLENLINRWGEDIGFKKWIEYCDRQRFTTTIEYFIEKYGEEVGRNKYEFFCKKRINSGGPTYSNVSNDLFIELNGRLKNRNYTTYFSENEWFFYDKENSKFYLIDFYIRELNIAIEFNGDVWHANPKKYKADDFYPFDKNIKVSEIWEKDRLKSEFISKKTNGFMLIWESDLNELGKNEMILKILKFIESYERNGI